MRQIIPFKKELLFKTKISEITSISLEHTLSLRRNNLISGEFHVSGDYKMTEASINREKFYFALPFEIDLGDSYVEDTINIDIDNFYYEVVNDDSLQVNIDVFVDGDKMEVVEEVKTEIKENKVEQEEIVDNSDDDCKDVDMVRGDDFFKSADEVKEIILDYEDNDEVEEKKNKIRDVEVNNSMEFEKEYESSIDYDSVVNKKINKNKDFFSDNVLSNINIDNDKVVEVNNKNTINNLNIFDSDVFSDETYATYYVYVVKEDDNIDKILEHFSTTKEELQNYNDLENVKKGTKLIIPSKNE